MPVALRRVLAWIGLSLALLFPCPARGEDWKFDVLRLKNGKTFQGVILSETPAEIRFRCVRRQPGSPTTVISTTFLRSEIEGIDRLGPEDRRLLSLKLQSLDPTGKVEAQRMEGLEIKPIPWVMKGGGEGLSYSSPYFVLRSNAREDIVRRAAVRLDQIYTAYRRFLPPRRPAGKPTTILLMRSLTEYYAYLGAQGRIMLNPAFYDGNRNQIVCATDLQRIGEELERVRKHHRTVLSELRAWEADLKKRHGGKIPSEARSKIAAKRQQVTAAENRNEEIFKEATQQLFKTLYHEAFHAYLANFVYPPGEGEVPRWLNEGLAQIFETALVEAGELRVGHADPGRLSRLKSQLRKKEGLPLTQLLKAGPQKFLVGHNRDKTESDQYYLSSWALAFYLTFDRRILGTAGLDQYLHELRRGTDSVEAFRLLVGEPISEFEKRFHQFVLSLRSDGSVASKEIGKEGPKANP